MPNLILLRHGESAWNLANRFTGWADVPLSARGEAEARAAGERLHGRRIDKLYTSALKRAVETVIDVNYFCRSTTIRVAGRAQVDGRLP